MVGRIASIPCVIESPNANKVLSAFTGFKEALSSNETSSYNAAQAFEDLSSLYFDYVIGPKLNISNADPSFFKLINEELRSYLKASGYVINGKDMRSILDFTESDVPLLKAIVLILGVTIELGSVTIFLFRAC